MIVRSHYGQHGDNCLGCKLPTLSYKTSAPKTHSHNDDPWEGNPVKERIEELAAAGKRYAAMEITKED